MQSDGEEPRAFGRKGALPAPRPDLALFLDIDGTLSDIAPTPDKAIIPPNILSTLQALVKAGTPVALISGRSLSSIDTMTAPHRFVAAGQHGLEIRDIAGRLHTPGADVAKRFAALAEEVESYRLARSGLVVENKGFAVSVHYRQAPQYEAEVKETLRLIALRHPDIVLQEGKMVAELRFKAGSKGQAIQALAATEPFAGWIPVFIGDDITDEDGFAAVDALDGFGIKVGGGPTCALYRAANPAQVGQWLQSVLMTAKTGETYE